MGSDTPDGLFDESLIERVVPDLSVIQAGAGIHKRFKSFDPDLVMMVPPSLDEWLPEVHLSRFIADVVDSQLDLSKFYASYAKAKGQPPYDPRLMVRVLLYGYCVGVRSSRELERACVDVVAFRWLTAQQAPDFRSIARFRKRHLSALGNVFLQALELCRAAGMVSLGQVALDGTKVRANASRRKAMSYARLTQRQKVLAEEVSDLLAEAEAIDTAEDTRFGKDKRGDELPAELARRETRLGKLAQARAALEADAAAKARKDAEQKAREHGDEDGAVKEKGQDAAAKAVVGPKTQRNFTDPDSRIMKTADGSFHYCYNGFCLVDKDHQVIVSNDLTNTPNDFEQLAPMIQKAEATLGVLPGQVLVDAGFCSVKNLEFAEGIEEASAGKTEFFIATRRLNAAEEAIMGTGQQQAAAATAKLRMVQRLRSKHGHDIYARRKAIVEPVFGQIHTRQGKHVLLRGLDQAKHEWDLIAGCHNLLKLFNATTAPSMNGLGT